jgi:hypothetical protein
MQQDIGQDYYSPGQGSQRRDRTWEDEHTQHGVNTGSLRANHDHGDPVLGLVTEFFGEDIIGSSYIPPESQTYAYNYASSSQQGYQTPPPMPESQPQEAEVVYGPGLRETRAPNRLSPSGRKARRRG